MNDTALKLAGSPEFSEGYLEQLRPFLMQQRRALLAQVDSIEELLEIAPSTADLRREAKRGIMLGKEGG